MEESLLPPLVMEEMSNFLTVVINCGYEKKVTPEGKIEHICETHF